ncbi:hypothetical protein GCM10027073_11800 [Streptomyces chlorus]
MRVRFTRQAAQLPHGISGRQRFALKIAAPGGLAERRVFLQPGQAQARAFLEATQGGGQPGALR